MRAPRRLRANLESQTGVLRVHVLGSVCMLPRARLAVRAQCLQLQGVSLSGGGVFLIRRRLEIHVEGERQHDEHEAMSEVRHPCLQPYAQSRRRLQAATRAQHQILMPTTSMFSLPSSHDVADVTERSPIHEKHEEEDERDRFDAFAFSAGKTGMLVRG